MELYDVMRTTFAARDFTDDELPDERSTEFSTTLVSLRAVVIVKVDE